MQKCPSCGFNNRPGVVFCENCGTSLLSGGSPLSTKALEADEQKDMDPGDQPPPSVVGSSSRTEIFPADGTLRLEIEGSTEPIYLGLNHREIVLGRRDPATGALPDVDLTPFAGYRMGVSRRHSQVRHSEEGHLDVFDLGSSNGTFLNGRRLEAHYPYRLHDGDKLALGQIVIRVYFEKPADEAVAPAAPVTKGTGTKPLVEEAAAKPEAAKPVDNVAQKPEVAKPVPPSSTPAVKPSPEAAKAEQKSTQSPPPAAPTTSAQQKTDSKPEAAKPTSTTAKPETAKPVDGGEKKPEAAKPTSPPLGTVTRPASQAKPEAEKPKQPPAKPVSATDGAASNSPTASKPEAKKADDSDASGLKKPEVMKDNKETPSKPDTPPKSSE